ncbi:serine/threonine-protein kinase [Streptomyces sp. ISL-94]|uniref:serine/threonine-protein kinase n=1 Tax=Streptomyces sp. ISL-94 TaxID=2819190 RepID=UPI001BE59325|nr:serine/threonine-protein kinase [Streptomyces sp. ISL-94]MBT2482412.1 serine/threonine protein kinase [Streptomyces sp. ISL-94]
MNSATEVFQPLQADDPTSMAGYRLVARLGAGGMGRVYLSHTQGGRPVAIKVVRPELSEDPAFRRRFRREVEAARRVRGAYTAELIDAEADGVPPWLATLYVPGPSLAEAVARRGPLPVPAVLWLMAGVAEALQAIHGAGIVHRDLKPSNVLLAADGPRVIDFGISLASGTTAPTATGSAIGTPQFMAPEQALAGESTAATDVFALGQTAGFAALGEPLYGDGPAMTVLYRIVHSEPDLSRLPEQLRPLIARCLAADPQERATPAEIVAWCRQRLGAAADGGGGPAVWREVAGPEVAIPAPLPHPTPVHTLPLVRQQPQPPAPDGPQERRARRRRTALIATVAVTTGTLLLTALVWTLGDVAGRLRDREASGAKPSGSAAGAQKTPSASAGSSPGGRTPGTSGSIPSSSPPPKPVLLPYPMVRLDEKSSIGIKEPVQREDRTGDIRLNCENAGCALESDSSVITMLFGEPHGSLDECWILLKGATARSFSLAPAAAGSEFCVKHPSGDIALLVLQIKSTVGPAGFVVADMTVARAA